jgi:hypothetical protein
MDQPNSAQDAPTSDLAHFLELQKVNYRRALGHQQAKQWIIVMGNEAGGAFPSFHNARRRRAERRRKEARPRARDEPNH